MTLIEQALDILNERRGYGPGAERAYAKQNAEMWADDVRARKAAHQKVLSKEEQNKAKSDEILSNGTLLTFKNLDKVKVGDTLITFKPFNVDLNKYNSAEATLNPASYAADTDPKYKNKVGKKFTVDSIQHKEFSKYNYYLLDLKGLAGKRAIRINANDYSDSIPFVLNK
jgi:hypothetical protein